MIAPLRRFLAAAAAALAASFSVELGVCSVAFAAEAVVPPAAAAAPSFSFARGVCTVVLPLIPLVEPVQQGWWQVHLALRE